MSIWEERGETRYCDVVGEKIKLWDVVPHFTLWGELEAAVSNHKTVGSKWTRTIVMMKIFGAIFPSLDTMRGAASTQRSNPRTTTTRESIASGQKFVTLERISLILCDFYMTSSLNVICDLHTRYGGLQKGCTPAPPCQTANMAKEHATFVTQTSYSNASHAGRLVMAA